MKKIIPLMLGLTLFSAPVLAADLLGIYRDAISHDAQFASARAERDAGLEKLPQGKAALRPQINFVADTKWNDTSTQLKVSPTISMGPFWGPLVGRFFPDHSSARYNTHSWGVSLTQPLFRWQNWAVYKQAELAGAAAETQYAAAKQDLIERVTQAYFDVLLAIEDVTAAEAQKAAIAEQLAMAKRNFEVGVTTITDTHEAQARHDLVTASEIAARNNLEVKRAALAMLIGKTADDLKTLKQGVIIQPPQPENAEQWVDSAQKNNLNVQLARSKYEIATREMEKNRAGHYPTLDLIATHGRQSTGSITFANNLGGTESDATIIGLQMTIPIYAGGLVASKTREALALRAKAQADLDNVRRLAALGARQSYLGVTSGLAQVQALEQALTSSQSSLDSNKLGYEVGVRVNIDVLNAQQQLYSTRRDLAKARLQTLMAQLKLKSATGSLTEQDLVAINDLLE